MTEQHEAILERLMRLDAKACVRMRPAYQRPARWYVYLGHVGAASREVGSWTSTFFENGSTPEEALEKMWAAILERSATADGCFLRYYCTGNVPIPGDDPQVWVRWSEEKDDWVDVEPNAEALQARNIPADRIRPYISMTRKPRNRTRKFPIVDPKHPVDYMSSATPPSYRCETCGATGVKLWREYQTFLNHQTLACMHCACAEQNKIRTSTEDGAALYTDVTHHWYRTANMPPGRWNGYDPKKGPPSDAIETRTARERTDQIGGRIPAVPTEANDTFWGYTSVPQAGCEWWRRLPTLPPTPDVADSAVSAA